uniref:Rep protein n=1 Tax=virus sp. ctjzo7 TaxID=2827994 RepID=A0A8S5S768_9VIRU|nr:MAG TPA: Rep protein [virus sp. ctjzo7]
MQKPQELAPKYLTWFVTVRPGDGMSEQLKDALKQWIQNATKYHFVYEEKQGIEKHWHICLWMKSPVCRSDLIKRILSLKAISEVWTGDQRKSFRQKKNVHIMYNFFVKEEYIDHHKKKGCFSEVIMDNIRTEKDYETAKLMFPEKEDKQALRPKRAADQRMNQMKELFIETRPNRELDGTITDHEISAWLYDMSYESKRIICQLDLKRAKDFGRGLRRYLNGGIGQMYESDETLMQREFYKENPLREDRVN